MKTVLKVHLWYMNYKLIQRQRFIKMLDGAVTTHAGILKQVIIITNDILKKSSFENMQALLQQDIL